MTCPNKEEIRSRAYELWEQRGRPIGSPEVDWLQAERELKDKLPRAVIFTPRQVADHVNYYLSQYDIIFNERLGAGSAKKVLGDQPCRFCGQSSPKVTFKKVAHAIPEAVGNKALTVNYECDACNDRFSAFEDDFAKYVLLDRYASQIAGKGGVPSLKSKRKLSRMDLEANGFVFKEVEGDPVATIDPIAKTLTVQIPSQKFYPLGVFKALTKMALTVLPESEVINFPDALRWLRQPDRSTSRIDEGLGYCCWRTFTPGPRPFDEPHALLLRRKADAAAFYCQFILMFGNTSFQIVVPCPTRDAELLGKTVYYTPIPIFSSLNPSLVKGPTLYWRESFSTSNQIEVMKSVIFSFDSFESNPPAED